MKKDSLKNLLNKLAAQRTSPSDDITQFNPSQPEVRTDDKTPPRPGGPLGDPTDDNSPIPGGPNTLFGCLHCRMYLENKLAGYNWNACKSHCKRYGGGGCEIYEPLVDPKYQDPEPPILPEGEELPTEDPDNICAKLDAARKCYMDRITGSCFRKIWRGVCGLPGHCTPDELCSRSGGNRDCYDCMHNPPLNPYDPDYFFGNPEDKNDCHAEDFCQFHQMTKTPKVSECYNLLKISRCCKSLPAELE